MKELSEFLRSEREKRGLPLESVAEQSGLSVTMLSCFESGDFECIGAQLLVRNIVRGYCKVFERDPEPILQEFAPQIGGLEYQEAGIREFGHRMKLFRKKRRMISFPLLLFALATVLTMYGGTWISEKRAKLYAPPAADQIFSQEELPPELLEKLAPQPGASGQQRRAGASRGDADLREADKAIVQAEKNIKDAEQVGSADRTADVNRQEAFKIAESEKSRDAVQQSAANRGEALPQRASGVALSNSMEVMAEDRPTNSQDLGKGFRFGVEANDQTWVQVRIDEKEARSAMLRPGDKREWTAQKGMQIVIGNAGGVSMRLDDQPIRASREPGRVLRFKLPEQAGSIPD